MSNTKTTSTFREKFCDPKTYAHAYPVPTLQAMALMLAEGVALINDQLERVADALGRLADAAASPVATTSNPATPAAKSPAARGKGGESSPAGA